MDLPRQVIHTRLRQTRHAVNHGSPVEQGNMNSNNNTSSPLEGIHVLSKKSPTQKSIRPQALCRQCSFEKKKKSVTTICSVCAVGLCNKDCFEKYHLRHGFQLIAAARRPNPPCPDRPRRQAGPSTNVSHSHPPSPADEQGTEARTPMRIHPIEYGNASPPDPNNHMLVSKPPTSGKRYPQVSCKQCKHEGRRERHDIRLICFACNTGLCSKSCFTSYHRRKGIPIASTESENNPSQDETSKSSSENDSDSNFEWPSPDHESESNFQEVSIINSPDQHNTYSSLTSSMMESEPRITRRILRPSTMRQRPLSPRTPLDLSIPRYPLDLRRHPLDLTSPKKTT